MLIQNIGTFVPYKSNINNNFNKYDTYNPSFTNRFDTYDRLISEFEKIIKNPETTSQKLREFMNKAAGSLTADELTGLITHIYENENTAIHKIKNEKTLLGFLNYTRNILSSEQYWRLVNSRNKDGLSAFETAPENLKRILFKFGQIQQKL